MHVNAATPSVTPSATPSSAPSSAPSAIGRAIEELTAPNLKRKRAAEESVRCKLRPEYTITSRQRKMLGWKGKGNIGQPRPTPTPRALLALFVARDGSSNPPEPKRSNHPSKLSRVRTTACGRRRGHPGVHRGSWGGGGGRGGGLARWGTGRVGRGSQR